MEAQTADDDYAKVARRLPGFAGLYLDENELVVAVVGDPDEAAVRRAALPLARARGIDHLPLRVAKAKYTYERMRAEYDRLMRTLEIEQLTFSSIDERANRIQIGVATLEALSALRRQLTQAGVPGDLVHVEVRPGFQRIPVSP